MTPSVIGFTPLQAAAPGAYFRKYRPRRSAFDGGKVTVESALGRGSTFIIRLPAACVSQPSAA